MNTQQICRPTVYRPADALKSSYWIQTNLLTELNEASWHFYVLGLGIKNQFSNNNIHSFIHFTLSYRARLTRHLLLSQSLCHQVFFHPCHQNYYILHTYLLTYLVSYYLCTCRTKSIKFFCLSQVENQLIFCFISPAAGSTSRVLHVIAR